MATPQLIDQYGRPLQRQILQEEIAVPTLTGVRSPIAGYQADGLNPARLAQLLREADQGEPMAYFELAETIEERDLHYAGVLGTRKRSVSQIDITVEAASDDAEDVRRADMVREWLKRDELQDEMFDILDAVGKCVSFTEIIWDTSEGQWWPARLEWRDTRWFRFDRLTQRIPMLRGGIDGREEATELPGFKFIYHQIKAKSGLPVRSGIGRLAAWAWMFKAFTQRDWALFTQTYGQPVRIGKFHSGATKEDRQTLFRAVANIAGDCAAIIPDSMEIEFIEAKNVSAGGELYEKRADWLDRQVSKGVLGQTNTTDAQAGGLGSGQAGVHNDVRQDIETADCKVTAATLNRDLIRPWMDLEFGPSSRGRYPRLMIGRPKQEDLKELRESLNIYVPMGLRVEASEIRDKLGLSEPAADAEVLAPKPSAPPPAEMPAKDKPAKGKTAPANDELDEDVEPAQVATQSTEPPHPAVHIASGMAPDAIAEIAQMAATIETMLSKAGDLGEFREMLANAYGHLGGQQLGAAIAAGLTIAQAAGRSDLVDESQ